MAAEFKSVKTRSGFTNTYPVYDRNQKLVGWRGRSEIRLESKDLQAMANLIGKLQSSMQLGGVAVHRVAGIRRQTENEMIAEGVAAFRSRADIARKALGGGATRSGGSHQHRWHDPRPAPDDGAARRGGVALAVPPPKFEGGTSTVQVSVNGTVEVE